MRRTQKHDELPRVWWYRHQPGAVRCLARCASLTATGTGTHSLTACDSTRTHGPIRSVAAGSSSRGSTTRADDQRASNAGVQAPTRRGTDDE